MFSGRQSSETQSARNVLAIALAGYAFFYIETFLVGYSAAIAYPAWYAEFVARHPTLGYMIWDLFTVVPVVLLSAAIVGALLGRIINRNFFIAGLAATVVAVLIAVVSTASDLGYVTAIRNHLIPAHWSNLPSHLAVWLALAFATMYFGRKSVKRQEDDAETPA